MPGKRVVVASQCKLLMGCFGLVIESMKIGEVVGEASMGSEAVRMARELEADFVVLEGSLPGWEPVEVIAEIRRLKLPTKVMIFSLTNGCVRRDLRLLFAGAVACLTSAVCSDEVARAFEVAERGGKYLGRELKALLDSGDWERDRPKKLRLTATERSVLKQIAEGYMSKEIAQRCCVSVETIYTHRKAIKRKTGLEGIAEITRYAVREGLIDP